MLSFPVALVYSEFRVHEYVYLFIYFRRDLMQILTFLIALGVQKRVKICHTFRD